MNGTTRPLATLTARALVPLAALVMAACVPGGRITPFGTPDLSSITVK